jgi:tetratricopeptide (TPR) repeat protein
MIKMTNDKIMDEELREFHEANTFIFKKEYDEAERLLRLGLKKARREKANDKVSFYLSALGHLYITQNKQAEALNFFEQADEVSSDYYSKLSYARILTTIYRDHDRALNKVTEALTRIPPKDQALNEAYSIIGLCFLGKDNQDKSLESFRESLNVDFERFASSESFDLTLMTELLNMGLHDIKMDSYLESVRKKAVEENNARLIKVTVELLEKIRHVKK